MHNPNIRALILEILNRVEREHAYLNVLLLDYFKQYHLKNEDKGLIQELTYGVTRLRKKLDWIIGQFLEDKNRKIPQTVQNILRMGIYQSLYLDKIPDYAVVNESVELGKDSPYSGYSKLINALLRNVIRQRENIRWPVMEKNPVKAISVFYSYPEWLVQRWIHRYGIDLCIRICQAGNARPSLTLRVNSLKTSMAELKKSLSELEVPFKEGQYVPEEALIAKEFTDFSHSSVFLKGWFSIQDESSILASVFLNPSADETIIDMCCGPGGKTMHMAQLMKNQGKIIAFDKNSKKLEMVREEGKRLGIGIVVTVQDDSSRFRSEYEEKADKILIDAPCSGTGVIRKKPDLKWKNFSKIQLEQLNRLQEAIVSVSARYLKPGGEMLYSTCSLEKEENDDVIRRFLAKNTCFCTQESSSLVRGRGIIRIDTDISESIQLLPGYSGEDVDGFYMVKMKKIGRMG